MRKEMNSEELRLESTECKRSEGITLIALIITIIILITLAVVSVRIVVNQNIFQHAERGAELYTVEQEKELIGIGYSEYKMKKYISEEGSQDNPEIQKLSKYFLSLSQDDMQMGEDEDGNPYIKLPSNDIINDAETSIVVMGVSAPSRQEQCLGNRSTGMIIKYNNNVYIVHMGGNGFTGEVEFNSTTLNLTENKEEQELLNSYFTANPFDEIYDDYTSKFKGDNNTIPDAETSIIHTGQDITGVDHIIKYKDRIYKIDITKAATCHDHDTYNGLELISMTNTTGNNQLQVKDANVEGDEEYGWTITFNGTGHVYTLYANGQINEAGTKGEHEETEDEKLLKKYFLGENGEGKVYTEVMTPINSNNEFGYSFKFIRNDVIADAETSIQVFNDMVVILYDENLNETGIAVYIEYHQNIYKVIMSSENDSFKITGVSLVYAPTGKEGQTIEYSYDGTEANKKQWTVLYDRGNTLEIISPDALGNLTLGASDEEASGSTDVEKAIDSYNNAITRLNRYCQNQITNSNKLSVRSAGSNPDNPNSENSKLVTHSWLGDDYKGVGKALDYNYEQDLVRTLYWNILTTSDSKDYWLASRYLYEWSMQSQVLYFCIRSVNSNTNELWSYFSTGVGKPHSSDQSNPVRPIVKINQ